MTKTELILRDMLQPGKASCLVGGQWGSESKGSAAAWLALELCKRGQQFDIVTTNAGAQAGHTSIHKGKKRVVYHLPTAPLITQDETGKSGVVYLNSGTIIDPEAFEKELNDSGFQGDVFIHPVAAVITDACREAELKPDSSHTKVAGTRKGVGQALSRKVARSGQVAQDHPFLKKFVRRLDLNWSLRAGKSVLIEVPQGVGLSLSHSPFYPYCTSRDCIPSSAMGDAAIHPSFYGATLVVLRTFPIRVGNIVENGKLLGQSGGCYKDQEETTWEDIGVEAEITTVTKRVRRVFTFSQQQLLETLSLCRPDVIFLTFTNYLKEQAKLDEIEEAILNASKVIFMPPPRIMYQWGPTTEDVGESYEVPQQSRLVPRSPCDNRASI